MCEEAVFFCAVEMMREGRIYQGFTVLMSYDCYMRTQDWRKVIGREIVDDDRSCSLRSGCVDRGLESKTGPGQGVVVARGYVADGLVALRDLGGDQAQVIPLTVERVRRDYQQFWKKRGRPKRRSLHDLRHTAAAEDVNSRRLELEGARRRGRWKHLSSVQRYTKEHEFVAARNEFGRHIVETGKMYSEDARHHIAAAIDEGPGRSSPEGKALVRAMRNPRIPDADIGMVHAKQSPRGERLPRPEGMPEKMMAELIKERGLQPKRGRRKLEEQVRQLEFLPEPPEAGLDSDDNTVGALTGDEGGSESEEEEEEVETPRVTRYRIGVSDPTAAAMAGRIRQDMVRAAKDKRGGGVGRRRSKNVITARAHPF